MLKILKYIKKILLPSNVKVKIVANHFITRRKGKLHRVSAPRCLPTLLHSTACRLQRITGSARYPAKLPSDGKDVGGALSESALGT